MNGRVLIIDEEAVVTEIFRIHTEGWGLLVTTAAGAGEGGRIAGSEDFDLVICRLVMRDGTGFDVLQAARSRRPDIPVFLMSEHWPAARRSRAEELGAESFYVPCDWAELRLRIQRELDERRRGQASPSEPDRS